MFVGLPHRALIQVGGAAPRQFLQGLVSADVDKATATTAVYGAFLTAQGRFLHEFFLADGPDGLLLETDASGRDDFLQRLARYNLRRTITLAPYDDWQVYAVFGADGDPPRPAGGMIVADPRLPAAGWRAWLPPDAAAALPAAECRGVDFAVWDRWRIEMGLPDGRRDLTPDKTILLEAGFDELGGVDWQKGCFLGQEVTARSKYRGHVRKRLMPVRIDGDAPPAGTVIRLGEDDVGEMGSSAGSVGLALIRLDALATGHPLQAGTASLAPWKPDWAIF